VRIENEFSFRTALTNSISLFLGAGFSTLANSTYSPKSGQSVTAPLPVGQKLADELTREFDLKGLSELSLPKLATVIKKTRRQEFESYLKARFSVTKFDPRYSKVFDVRVRSVFTTNIDNLVPLLLSNHRSKYLHDVTLKGPSTADTAVVRYFPLHGSVAHEQPDYKFTTEELITAFGQDPDRFHYLSKELQDFPTLFWGYSLGDAGVIEALSDETTRARGTAPKWIALRKEESGAEAYFKALNFNIIVADTAELLDYLATVKVETVDPSQRRVNTKDLFPDNFVPASGEIKVRPITAFLSGDEPEWYDVYSNAIYRTSHFEALRNAINSGKHSLFVGIPGSGKSTLLKQLATDPRPGVHRLFLNLITPEQVSSIQHRLSGQRAIAFVDDFPDDVYAMRSLMAIPNIQVVGCAREFGFDIISHLLDLRSATVLNVSELSDFDIQAIFDHIPTSIRAEGLRRPDKDGEQTTSFFELVESNIRTPHLKKRMYEALAQVQSADPILYEALVAIAYVFSCGTPMTTDMVHAFLRPHRVDVMEIPDLLSRLGSLLREYYGIEADNLQDNFVIRSKLMADVMLQNTPAQDFRRVFEQFHEEVSPYRITRFDVFRRRAFDERFATKAFPNWKDGLKFYEAAYSRDGSPELLQQCALYLSRRNETKLAFQWIDQARLKAPKSFSVRNSHAIVLFRANIGLASTDPSVALLLKQSMYILADCYKSDKRKTYHAMVFGDQALEMLKALGRAEAEEYLVDAKEWLALEAKISPWNRRVKQLLRAVSRAV
jgi:hypothetical protein